MKRHRRECGTGYNRAPFRAVARDGGTGRCLRWKRRAVDFVCLPRSFAYDRILSVARETGVVCPDITVRGEAATADKNEEGRCDEERSHLLNPCLPRPQLYPSSLWLNSGYRGCQGGGPVVPSLDRAGWAWAPAGARVHLARCWRVPARPAVFQHPHAGSDLSRRLGQDTVATHRYFR
jgi:hypothetical protein